MIDPTPAFVQAQIDAHTAVDAGRVADQDESMSLRRGDFHNRKLMFGPTPWMWKQGVVGEDLDEPQFYNAIGRGDLAEAQSANVSKKTTVLLSSGLLTAVGVGLGFVGFLGGGLDGEMPQMALGIGGLAGVALGTGGLVWGAGIDTHPVSLDEARELGDAHNRRLAAELGVDPNTQP